MSGDAPPPRPERAILERAARAQSSSSWLLDPKLLGAAMQAGRTFGWQRIVPVALLGLIAAQWLRATRTVPTIAAISRT